MKIRLGFVSNSSSSSFTCVICKEDVSGMDLGIDEAGMCECVNGHIFCQDHLTKQFTTHDKRQLVMKKMTDEEKEEVHAMNDEEFEEKWEENYKYEYEYNVPEAVCPICQFNEVCEVEGFYYLLVLNNMSVKSFLSEIKTTFKDYKGLKKYISKLYKHED